MMKYFLIISVLAAAKLLTGKVVNDDEPLIIATRMPKLSADTFNRKIGVCTYKEILYDTHSCQKSFYQSFRTDPSLPCNKRHAPLEKCVLKKMASCFKSVLSSEKFKEVMKKNQLAMEATKQYHCGLKRYKVSDFMKEGVDDKKCSAEFGTRIDACPSSFLDMFLKRPGDIRLCRVYRKNTQCMKSAIEKYCSFDFSKSNWIFGDALNPFCDDKQMKNLKQDKQ